jgi:hypothetical protein
MRRVAVRDLPKGHPRLRVPFRPIRRRWPSWLGKRFEEQCWADPAVLLDEDATPEAFSATIGQVEVGGTFKMTSANRHPGCDELLVTHLDLTGATIVDLGASDGTTSLELFRRLPPGFATFVISDRYLHVGMRRFRWHTVLVDPFDSRCVLVFGRRVIAWPQRSRLLRLAYAPLLRSAEEHPGRLREVSLLNPAVRALIASDPRVISAEHDVFELWEGPPPDVLEVANLLRRIYFNDEDITAALDALRRSLPEGGHLLVVDNPYLPGVDARAGLYRRAGDRFVTVAMTDEVPEINDLVLADDPTAAVGRQEVGRR